MAQEGSKMRMHSNFEILSFPVLFLILSLPYGLASKPVRDLSGFLGTGNTFPDDVNLDFRVLDINQDGELNPEEFSANYYERKSLFESVDFDHNNAIGYLEFKEWRALKDDERTFKTTRTEYRFENVKNPCVLRLFGDVESGKSCHDDYTRE